MARIDQEQKSVIQNYLNEVVAPFAEIMRKELKSLDISCTEISINSWELQSKRGAQRLVIDDIDKKGVVVVARNGIPYSILTPFGKIMFIDFNSCAYFGNKLTSHLVTKYQADKIPLKDGDEGYILGIDENGKPLPRIAPKEIVDISSRDYSIIETLWSEIWSEEAVQKGWSIHTLATIGITSIAGIIALLGLIKVGSSSNKIPEGDISGGNDSRTPPGGGTPLEKSSMTGEKYVRQGMPNVSAPTSKPAEKEGEKGSNEGNPNTEQTKFFLTDGKQQISDIFNLKQPSVKVNLQLGSTDPEIKQLVTDLLRDQQVKELLDNLVNQNMNINHSNQNETDTLGEIKVSNLVEVY